jgi:hypothetical protein
MTCNLQGGPASPVYLVDFQGQVLGTDWLVTSVMDVVANDQDKSWDVPAGQEWQILWVHVRLTTTGTAGDRQLEIRIERPGAAMDPIGIWAAAGAVQAASLTREYIFAPGLADLTDFRDTDKLTTPIPVTDILRAGDRLRVRENSGTDANDDMNVWVQYAWREVDR